ICLIEELLGLANVVLLERLHSVSVQLLYRRVIALLGQGEVEFLAADWKASIADHGKRQTQWQGTHRRKNPIQARPAGLLGGAEALLVLMAVSGSGLGWRAHWQVAAF